MKRKSVFNLSKILVFALLPYLSVSVINGSERILLNYRPDLEVYLTAVLSCQISPDYELQTVDCEKQSFPEICGGGKSAGCVERNGEKYKESVEMVDI